MTANPVAAAVAHLKDEAIQAAAHEAVRTIEREAKILDEAAHDFGNPAPFPRSFNLGREEYLKKKAHYTLVSSLVSLRSTGINKWDAALSDAKTARFVELAKEEAAAAYDLYVMKLVGKIGPCKTAKLVGNHIWSKSTLVVTFEDKLPEKWTTRTIINISKLGKVFLQWPTRKIKW